MTDLRPRPLGEILDRGLALYVRTFAKSSLIIFPLCLVDAAPAAFFHAADARAKAVSFLVYLFLVHVPCYAICFGAIATAFSRELVAKRWTVRDCYGVALLRFWPGLGIQLTYIALVVVCIVTLGLAALAMVPIRHVLGLGPGFLILAASPLLAIELGVIAFAALVFVMAIIACVSERSGIRQSIATALRRCWTPHRRLASVAFSAIALLPNGTVIAIYEVALLRAHVASSLASTIFAVAANLATSLSYAWIAAYNVDLRIRSEGLDLQVEMHRLSPLETASPQTS